MKLRNMIVLAGVSLAAITLLAPPAWAQTPACQDEEGMAQAMVQTAAAMVDTVKKETLADFEAKYHQKNVSNKLMFAASAVDGAVDCLGKATGDPTAAARKDAESKLAAKLSGYRTDLKAKADPKAAKELIGTFDLPAPAK